MTWNPTDETGGPNHVNSAMLFRQADNAVERWTKRGRMASICYDYRDPVDIAAAQPMVYRFTDIRILPGFSSLKLKLRNRVTDIAGVDVSFSCEGVTASTPVTIVSTADNNHEVTLDITGWIETHDITSETLTLLMTVTSNETADAPIVINLAWVSEHFLSTTTLGGIAGDSLDAFVITLIDGIKGASRPPSQMPGGPYQVIRNSTHSSPTEARWHMWPIMFGVNMGNIVGVGQFSIFDGVWDSISLQRIARLQFWSLGIEQVSGTPSGRSRHKPIISDGIQTKATLRPAYPARAATQRPLYAEGERMHEMHTVIHSQGPYGGTMGLDRFSPSATDLINGSWAGFPTAYWSNADSSQKLLFGCRVGDDSEFRLDGGGTTMTRRGITIDLTLLFVGGDTYQHQFDIFVETSTAGSATAVYTSQPTQLLVQGWNPGLALSASTFGSSGVTDPTALLATTFGQISDMVAPGAANLHRRTNIDGLWNTSSTDILDAHIIKRRIKIFHGDDTASDPETLTVDCHPVLSGATLGDGRPQTGDIRCFVLGWCVSSTQLGPPTAVGV